MKTLLHLLSEDAHISRLCLAARKKQRIGNEVWRGPLAMFLLFSILALTVAILALSPYKS